MKNTFSYLVIIAACVGCIEVNDHPSEGTDNSYGVHFPNQQEGPFIIRENVDKETYYIDVKRKKTSGNILVPVVCDNSGDDLFTVGSLIFSDGEDLATIKVEFDASRAYNGGRYSLQLSIEDKEYISSYTAGASHTILSVIKSVPQYLGVDKNGKVISVFDKSKAAPISWEMNRWGLTGSGIISYYEAGDERLCRTISDGGNGFWGTDEEFEFTWYFKKFDNKGRQPIFFSPQYAVKNEKGVVTTVFDWYSYLLKHSIPSQKPKDFLSFASTAAEGTPVSYYDGHGGFYFCSAGYEYKGGRYDGRNPDMTGSVEGVSYIEGYLTAELANNRQSETSLDIAVKGDYLTSARIALFFTADVEFDYEARLKDMKSVTPVSSTVLRSINNHSYSARFNNLVPGMEYTLLILASTDFQEQIVWQSSSVSTAGTIPPKYAGSYSVKDYDKTLRPAAEKELYGTWEYYARDVWDATAIRKYCGDVTISNSDTKNIEPDDDLPDEYVTISGLSGKWGEEQDIDDSITFDLYDGYLYISDVNTITGENGIERVVTNDKKTIVDVFYREGPDINICSAIFSMFFIPVTEGCFALVENYENESDFRNLSGIAFSDSSGILAWFEDVLLVDEDRIGVGRLPSLIPGIDRKIHAAKQVIRKINYVETPEGARLSAMERAIEAANNTVHFWSDPESVL